MSETGYAESVDIANQQTYLACRELFRLQVTGSIFFSVHQSPDFVRNSPYLKELKKKYHAYDG